MAAGGGPCSLVVKVVAKEIDWHAPLEREPKGGKRRGEPKAELSLELVLEGVGGEGGGVRTVDTDIEGLCWVAARIGDRLRRVKRDTVGCRH